MKTLSTYDNPEDSQRCYGSPIAWSAIVAGVFAALTISSLLNLLGVGLGFTAFKVDADALAALGTGAIIWIIISTIVSMAIGGWVAGRLNGAKHYLTGFFQGFLTWSAATVITLIFITSSVGTIVSGAVDLVGSSLSAVGNTASAVSSTVGSVSQQVAPQIGKEVQKLVPDLTPAINQIQEQAEEVLSKSQAGQAAQQTAQTIANDPEKAKKQLKKAITGFLSAIDSGDYQQAQQKVIDTLVQTGMNQDEAQQKVQEWQQAYNDAKALVQQKAKEAKQQTIIAAEKTSATIGRIALVTFLVLLCGGLAASLAGMFAAKNSRQRISAL